MPNCPRGRGCSSGRPDRRRRSSGGTTPRLLPIADGEGDRPKPRRGEEGWRGADHSSPPRFAGRGTTRSVVEGRRPHSPPLHHPSDGPPPHSLREQGGDTLRSQSADCQHISARQPTDSNGFPKIPASQTIRAGTRVRLPSSRRWGGRRIQRPDVGGLWSSDEARGMDTSGVLVEVDGWPPPARRALPERAAVSCPPRVVDSNVGGGDPVRSEPRATTRRARGKRLRGAAPSLPDRDFTGGSEGRPRSGFVETVKLSKHRARPGRPAPSPTFPAAMPEGDQSWVIGGW